MSASPLVRTAMASGRSFSMSELVRLTHVAPSTIRYYITTGLLPPARQVASNRYLYDDRHVESLRLIRLLKERRHLPVEAIRRIMPDLLLLPADGAFRPEMWEVVVEARERSTRLSSPGARLLEAGIAAFDSHGYAEVRVDDVCQAAHVAKGSFYRHFASKEELFFAAARAVAARAAEHFAEAVGETPIQPDEAVGLLADGLRPHLSLVLDLVALAAQRRPGHGRVLREVFTELHRTVRTRLVPMAPPVAAEEVLERALMNGIRQVVVSPILEAELFPGEAGY